MSGTQTRVGAVLAGALVVALGLWILLPDDDEQAQPNTTSQVATGTAQRLDEGALVDRSRSLETRPYWVGPRKGHAYELTTTRADRTFVRYLPAGVNPGDPRPDFLTVATYPLGTTGRAALRSAGRETGAQTVELPGGALMATNPAQPTSAYYARRGWRFEVEVYQPHGRRGDAPGALGRGAGGPLTCSPPECASRCAWRACRSLCGVPSMRRELLHRARQVVKAAFLRSFHATLCHGSHA